MRFRLLIAAYFLSAFSLFFAGVAPVFSEPISKDVQQTGEKSVTTLTFRTSDGIVVVDAERERIETLSRDIASTDAELKTIKTLFRWLIGYGISEANVRIYANLSEKSKTGPGITGATFRETTIEDALQTGEIPDISGLELFEAYVLLRAVGIRVFLDANAVEKSEYVGIVPHTVFVLSSAFGSGQDGIFVDGVDYSTSVNGYNLVSFASDGQVMKSQSFNMFDRPEAGGEMATFLSSLPEGAVVAASIKTGPGVFLTSGAIDGLHSCGSASSPDPEVLSSHAMLGKKGFAPGTALEAEAVNLESRVIVFGEQLYVTNEKARVLFAKRADRAVLLTGTSKKDRLLIYGPAF